MPIDMEERVEAKANWVLVAGMRIHPRMADSNFHARAIPEAV
jgi:hypothetical protein